MAIDTWIAQVTCDFCENHEEISFTPGERMAKEEVEKQLKYMGWLITDDGYLCESCVDNIESKIKERER